MSWLWGHVSAAWDWIVQNKQWVFSGIGGTALLALWWVIKKLFGRNKNNPTSGSNPQFNINVSPNISPVISPIQSTTQTTSSPERWNRTTRKLHTRALVLAPQRWIQKPGAFTPIVDQSTFDRAQVARRKWTDRIWSNQELIAKLRWLLSEARYHRSFLAHFENRLEGSGRDLSAISLPLPGETPSSALKERPLTRDSHCPR